MEMFDACKIFAKRDSNTLQPEHRLLGVVDEFCRMPNISPP